MPVLRMIRREKYAQARARGLTQKEATIDAGYERDPTHPNRTSNRLEAEPEVKARIAELLEAHGETKRIAEAKAVEAKAFDDAMGKAEVLQGLKTVFKMAIEAQPVLDKEGNEKGFTVNLNAANRALELMGKEEGMFVDITKRINDPGDGMTKNQLLEAIGRIDERLLQLGSAALPAPLVIDHDPAE